MTVVSIAALEASPLGGVGFGPAVLRHNARLLRRGAAIVVAVSAGMSALVVAQHRSLFGDSFDASTLESLAGSPAIRVMFGTPVALDDPGGFTVWRTGTPVALLVAVWAALTMIRISRGEEESGRWDLLLAGPRRLTGLVALALSVGLACCAVVGLAVSAAMIVSGASVTGAVCYGAGLAMVGAGAAALGALAGQLVPDRRRAAAGAGAVIGAGYLVRMVADGIDTLHWLSWTTPFGLLSLSQPFALNRPAPLVIMVLAAVMLAAAALISSAHRDLNAGVIPLRSRHRARPGWFRSLGRFAAGRTVGPVLAWGAGLGLYFLVVGLLASAVTTFLAENPAFAAMAAQAGFGSLVTVEGFVAALYALLAIPLGLFAAGRVGASASDEETRRLTMVFAAPVSRTRWFLAEIMSAAAGTVALALTAGLASWLGTRAVGAELGLGSAVAGTVNVVPVAILGLSFAVLALGWVPKAVLPIGAIPVAGGFLLQVLADSLQWPEVVKDLSPFAHLGAVPYESVDWLGGLVMTGVAAALALVGLYGFRRRDLRC